MMQGDEGNYLHSLVFQSHQEVDEKPNCLVTIIEADTCYKIGEGRLGDAFRVVLDV